MLPLTASPMVWVPGLAGFAILIGILLASAVTDLRHRRVPNAIVIFGAVVLLAASAVSGGDAFTKSLLGLGLALLIGFPAFAVGWFGGGDVKLFMLVGMGVGPTQLLLTLPWILIAGGVVALVYRSSSSVPYAVAILAGVVIERCWFTLTGNFYDLA
jgi:leader peptidase (prepilin peptidase)/N-methyltransferase